MSLSISAARPHQRRHARTALPLLVPAAFLMACATATAQESVAAATGLAVALAPDDQHPIHYAWLITCTGLVLLMQIGFLMLEAGATRSKNSINVAQKNLCDMLISVTVFALIGFSLMFGTSQAGIIGWNKDHLMAGFQDAWAYAFLAFQAMFAGAAATIVSGAVAERMTLRAYALITLLIAVLIYPVFGHWAWGHLLEPANTAWLAGLGFMDFAGSTVVHATGGWVALIAVWMLGARRDRYTDDGAPRRMFGHSSVLSVAGAMVLFVGWLGFNGGSVARVDSDVGQIILNTILAGAAGGMAATTAGRWRDGVFLPARAINGLLGGLVAVTAGANVVSPLGACLTGFLAGILVVLAHDLLERRLRLDDVVGAVSVHGVCGSFGTLAVAAFAMEGTMTAGSRLDQLVAQAIGVGIHAAWVSAVAIPAIWLIRHAGILRVSDHDEAIGLNIAEHGASLGSHALQQSLAAIAEGRADLATRLDETTGDDAAELAIILNPFLARVQALVSGVSESSARLATQLQGHADHVSRSAGLQAALTGQIGASAQSLRGSADAALGEVRSVLDSGKGLAGTADDLCTDIRQICAFVETLSDSVGAFARDAREAARVSGQAADLSQAASDTVAQLGHAADDIEAVVDLIIAIQNQTSTLALNATIEAARAGEQGKGFAIVASEIKALSQRTASATEGISEAVQRVRTSAEGSKAMIGDVGAILQTIATAVAVLQTGAQSQRADADAMAGHVARAATRTDGIVQGAERVVEAARTAGRTMGRATAHARAAESLVQDMRAQAEDGLETARTASTFSHELEGMAVGLSHRSGHLAD